MENVIRYGGRAGGAFLAYKYLAHRVGGGMIGTVAVVALGWLAAGYVADMAATKIAVASNTTVGN